MGDDIYEYYFKEQSYESHKEPHYITQQYIRHLEKKRDELQAVINEVTDAITNEGKVPKHHKEVLKKHRAEWPFLWERLDKLIALATRD